jgi:hypothetical protein
MNINNIITQLKTNCPSISTVDGAIKLMSAMESPPQGISAYVIPTGEQAQANSTINVITQHIDAGFGVLIMMVFDMDDPTGAQAYTDIQAVREEVMSALLGFVPFDGADPIEHASGSLANLMPGIIMWSDEFNTGYYRRAV